MKFFKKDANRLCIAVGVVLMTVFLSDVVDGSSLLACMALGAFMVNLSSEIDGMIKVANNFTPPINVLFFAISGAGFALGELKSIGLIGIVYVVTRVIGKMAGAYVGGRLTKQDKNTCKYLGPTLMPQAGVALGLIMVAQNILPQYGPMIRTVILCSTFIYSILGPSVAKWALIKAGEIHA
jgi:Kef-type K+ transport system membrane component KefB